MLTSSLYSLKASADSKKVRVEIIRDPMGESDCFFSTELYPIDGVVEFSDIGTLIEEHFREKKLIWADIDIRVDNVSTLFTALYCEYILDPDFDPSNCFLCASGTSVVHRNSAISLAHLGNGQIEYQVKIVGADSHGNTASVIRTINIEKPSFEISFSVKDIINAAISPADGGSPLASVAYFAISYGSHQKLFYIVDHPFYLTFCFRNMFNALEYLDVVGIVKRKTTVDSETAICAGAVRQYNQTVERTYEVETAPLTDAQARELEQLISSRSIRLCASVYDYDIIITDHTLEVDNDDENLSSVKFSFRFVNNRPHLIDSEMGALMPSVSHIFSHEFTAEFA